MDYVTQIRWLRTFAMLAMALAVGACSQVAVVATKTVKAVGEAELLAASAGRDAYLAEMAKLTDAASAKRAALGCAPRGECPDPAWVEYRDDAREEKAAAKERWRVFRLAMVTLNAALTETAIAVRVYLDTGGEIDLGAIVSGLLKSWSVVAALLGEYGVTPPTILAGGA